MHNDPFLLGCQTSNVPYISPLWHVQCHIIQLGLSHTRHQTPWHFPHLSQTHSLISRLSLNLTIHSILDLLNPNHCLVCNSLLSHSIFQQNSQGALLARELSQQRITKLTAAIRDSNSQRTFIRDTVSCSFFIVVSILSTLYLISQRKLWLWRLRTDLWTKNIISFSRYLQGFSTSFLRMMSSFRSHHVHSWVLFYS